MTGNVATRVSTALAAVLALVAGSLITASPASAATPQLHALYLCGATTTQPQCPAVAPGTIYVIGNASDSDTPGAPVRVDFHIGNPIEFHSMTTNSGGHFEGAISSPGAWGKTGVPISIWGIDTWDSSQNSLFYSGYVDVADPHPFGDVNEDQMSSPGVGAVHVRGWAMDPNTPTSPINALVTIGGPADAAGVESHVVVANTSRPDVGSAHPGYGDNHGIDVVLNSSRRGSQPVYVYALNAPGSPGADRLLGVTTIAIQADTVPPQTSISGPWEVRPNTPFAISFTSAEPGVRFECRWDRQPWEPCTSPTTHTKAQTDMYWVRAIDSAGNVDPTPATWVVKVTADAPATPPDGTTAYDRTLKAKAVKRRSKLRVDVDPDLASDDYRVLIQRKVRTRKGARWRKVRTITTKGARDTRTLNLPRGRYRALLPAQAQYPRVVSKAVRLRR